MSEEGAQTRRRIVEVATRLFAEHGVGSVSIRSINAAANRSPTAVHYHFGSKDRLLRAVLDGRGATVGADNAARLRALASRPDPPSAYDLVDALAASYVELLRREPVAGARWLNVVGQLVQSDHPLLRRPSEATDLLQGQIRRAYPRAPEAARRAAASMAAATLLLNLGRLQRGTGDGAAIPDDRAVRVLVNFVAGGVDGALRPARRRAGGTPTRSRRAAGAASGLL